MVGLSDGDAHDKQDELFDPLTGLYVPAGHSAQVIWPALGLNDPVGHKTHDAAAEAPTTVLKVPAGHS